LGQYRCIAQAAARRTAKACGNLQAVHEVRTGHAGEGDAGTCTGFRGAESQDIPALGSAEGALRLGLGNLFAVAENYPDLKTNDTFKHLQARVTGLENAIADRREFYNESVNVNNVRIEQFPDVIVARLLGFQPFTLLKFSSKEKADVNMRHLFNA